MTFDDGKKKSFAELLQNADAVVRIFEVTFEVFDKGHATETEHKAITLLNDRAQNATDQYFEYDKIAEIDDIEGAVYDADGKLVRKIKKKDISDGKAYKEYVDDNRIKWLKFPRLALPFTIEYTVKYKYNGLLFYPLFRPQHSNHEAVEAASLVVKMPAGLPFRVHENASASLGRQTSNTWSFSNIAAIKPELFAPVELDKSPEVICAPTEFSLEGYDGNMDSWKNFGIFMNKLLENRQKLPPETVAMLRKLVADCPNDVCKTERIYRFLQQNTRYFLIGLGIGGWQPAPAAQVDALKYGDCKGLSNYLVAMLAAVGVDARYVVIRAGKNERVQYPDFPNAYFSHIIACVPNAGDSIWLECTSQTMPFGFLGDFTDNRPALLIAPDGGHLVCTPKYDEKDNFEQFENELFLDENGNARVKSSQVFGGIPLEFFSELSQFNSDFQKKYLYNLLKIKDFTIDSFQFERKTGRRPTINLDLELGLPAFASKSGKRLFLPTCLFSKMDCPVGDGSERRSEVQADSRGITEIQTSKFNLPAGFSVENLPQNIHLSNDFGQFDFEAKKLNSEILVFRKLILNNKILTSEKFGELIDFLKKVDTADDSIIVLVHG